MWVLILWWLSGIGVVGDIVEKALGQVLCIINPEILVCHLNFPALLDLSKK